MIVTDNRVAHLVSHITGGAFVPPFTCMGIERNGEVIAGVIFNVFERSDVHVSIAGTGWTPAFCREVGRYVFETLQCERITAVTEQPKIVRLAERMGGQIEGCLRNHFGKGRDGFIVGILKDEYRFNA